MEKQLVLTFSVQEVENLILKGLGKLPAEESFAIIVKIKQEATKQLQPVEKEKTE